MGIPHLITFLQPFSSTESLLNQQVVIDGPGFAHHIYYICLGSSERAKNAFEAAPSYFGLVKAASAWLEALQDGGVKIEKIYFDGFLPPSKLDTRLLRLSKSTTRLSQYHTKYPTPCRASIEPSATSVLFGTPSVRSCLGTLPPLPFLVPAILEALLSSNFKEVVEVVPGEADLYCAKHVKEHGGIVLTGDSDLLVHDIGDNGAVSFFKDILSEETTGLSSLVYHPSIIADRLSLPSPNGMHFLAFEMSMETHATFPKLIAQAKLKTSFHAFPTQFQEFVKEYQHLPNESRVNSNAKCSTVCLVLRKMDPRLSEYVLQYPALAQIAGQVPVGQAPEHLQVFLPFILDCPVRTNSWEISAELRKLGYCLINFILPEDQQRFSVFEHRRQQHKSKGLELQLPSLENLPDICASLVGALLKIQDKTASLSSVDYWIAVAVYQEIEWSYLYDKSSLSEIVLRKAAESKSHQHTLSWDMIHFLAQVQGSIYSFRLLKQLMGLVMTQLGTAVSHDIISLYKQLDSLPALSKLPSYGDADALLQRLHQSRVTTSCRDILGRHDLQASEVPAKTNPGCKKGKRKRDKSASTILKDRKKSSNPFDLLDVE